ncbi:MAG TPA: AraC family ligand binding domain-containing protein, partial [Flavisolibacter sp.]|nr:AraC family ligand binding domain-containing protein [Flavisolibacter sp.]
MVIESAYGSRSIIDLFPAFENNRITFSRLSKVSADIGVTTTYGIKYVLEEKESYLVNGHEYKVNAGSFLLVNAGQHLACEFKHETTVKGICIHLNPDLLGRMYYELQTSEEQLLDYPGDATIFPEFHEAVYAPSYPLSCFLKKFVLETNNMPAEEPAMSEMYQNIAFQLLSTQKITMAQIQKINASRKSTKKELFNRLIKA